jgi:hypothetical protein
MTHHRENQAGAPKSSGSAPESLDEATGLPWPPTWPGIYAFVLILFALWVILLVVLERSFS